MPKRVTHICRVSNFDLLQPGDVYYSFCGKGFIADQSPTAEEDRQIREKTSNDPVCGKCRKAKDREQRIKSHCSVTAEED